MKFFRLAALLFVASFSVQAVELEAGKSYHNIVPAQPTNSGEKIEVVEVFSYACSHCFRFEPHLKRWLKNIPDNVEFIHMPAIFNDRLEVYARAFYAAEVLGELDKVHEAFFDAIHVQKRPLTSQKAIVKLAVENGIDQVRFEKAFRSFSVDAKVRRAKELGARYGISATPSMVVNGKYRMDPGMTGGFGGMLKVVDQLIEKESK